MTKIHKTFESFVKNQKHGFLERSTDNDYIYLLKFDSYNIPDPSLLLGGYYGYFEVDGDKKDIRNLSKSDVEKYILEGYDYIVPLTVRDVDRFKLNDKVVYRHSDEDPNLKGYRGESIKLLDSEEALDYVNSNPSNFKLIVIDEESKHNLDKVMKNKNESYD